MRVLINVLSMTKRCMCVCIGIPHGRELGHSLSCIHVQGCLFPALHGMGTRFCCPVPSGKSMPICPHVHSFVRFPFIPFHGEYYILSQGGSEPSKSSLEKQLVFARPVRESQSQKGNRVSTNQIDCELCPCPTQRGHATFID